MDLEQLSGTCRSAGSARAAAFRRQRWRRLSSCPSFLPGRRCRRRLPQTPTPRDPQRRSLRLSSSPPAATASQGSTLWTWRRGRGGCRRPIRRRRCCLTALSLRRRRRRQQSWQAGWASRCWGSTSLWRHICCRMRRRCRQVHATGRLPVYCGPCTSCRRPCRQSCLR